MPSNNYLRMTYVVTKDEVWDLFKSIEIAISPMGLERFLLTKAAPFIAARAAARFESEGDSASGGKWAPLSPATLQIRAEGRESGMWGVGDAHPINVRTQQMERYVTSGIGEIIATGSGGVTLQYPGGDALSVTDKLRTAQQGAPSSGNFRATPARPVLALDYVDVEYLLVELKDWIEDLDEGFGADITAMNIAGESV